MCQTAIRSLIHLMRSEPESLSVFEAYNRIERFTSSATTRAEIIFALADILEEHTVASWDYEIPHKCQFETTHTSHTQGPYESNCQEPAPYRVWWLGGGEMWVCQEHFEFMQDAEKEYREQAKTAIL